MHKLECSFLDGSVCQLRSTSKIEAIKELIKKASVFHIIEDTDQLTEKVIDRENERTTSLGHGIAVAHAQYDGINNVVMALGISNQGIEYQSMDDLPVKLLFLIASSPAYQNEYLVALSALVKLIRKQDFRENILNLKSIQEIEDILHDKFCSLLSAEA